MKKTLLLLLPTTLLLLGAKCPADCDKLRLAAGAACAADPAGQACQAAKLALEASCPAPGPTPTPLPRCSVTLCPPGKHCVEGQGCVPTPEPTPTPTQVPPAEPTPVPGCPSNEPDLVVNESQPAPVMRFALEEAKAAVSPDPRGRPPAETLAALGREFRKAGRCAIVGIEAVFLRRSDGLFEEYHAVAFTDGGWTGSPFKGIHRLAGEGPVAGACPAPVPPRLNEDGVAHFVIKAKPHGRWVDSTPVLERALAYCQAIGMGEMDPGVPRASCPARPDGHPDRVACEAVLLAGGPAWESDRGRLEVNRDNPFQARCLDGGCSRVRVCAQDRLACSPWVVAP